MHDIRITVFVYAFLFTQFFSSFSSSTYYLYWCSLVSRTAYGIYNINIYVDCVHMSFIPGIPVHKYIALYTNTYEPAHSCFVLLTTFLEESYVDTNT